MRVVPIATSLVVLASCSECDPVQTADAGVVDAGDPDPDAVGFDVRPVNATCRVPPRPVIDSGVTVEQPWPQLTMVAPLLMLEEPGTDRMWVVERGGRIVRFDQNDPNVAAAEVVLDLIERVETTNIGADERGLLGAAFHPDWPDVAEFFVAYTGLSGDAALVDRVSRFTLGDDGLLDANSERAVFDFDSFAQNHNGGNIAFSPLDPCRTCLYYGTGDGGGQGDGRENGQNPSVLAAKILRVDVDSGDAPYVVPADNPFVGVDGFAPEAWALGFRNPWRWSFDRLTGELWLGDVGEAVWEEINLVERGGNYGWNTYEGTDCFDDLDANGVAGECLRGGFEEPIVEYRHEGGGRNSIVGGTVYRGSAMPSLVGTYIYADHRTGEVFALLYDNLGAPAPIVIVDLDVPIGSFAEDLDGELYVIDYLGGQVRRLIAAPTLPPGEPFPQLLSQTGCADVDDPRALTAGMIPYAIAHPFHSDGASKTRALALPDGATITVAPDGDLDLPIGSVVRKDFTLNGAPIETRLLMRHDDGEWAGYTYRWNAEQRDATLVDPAGASLDVDDQRWSFPSRNGCLACHTSVAGRTLGLELAQLNIGFVYDGERFANQLRTLDHVGLLELESAPDANDHFPAVDHDGAPIDALARAYLHVNCSMCHRPGGLGAADTDWRAPTAFASMGLCDVAPIDGDLGVDGARRLAPGDPARSLVSVRMKVQGVGRMPQLGSVVVDARGTEIVDAWITSMDSCERD